MHKKQRLCLLTGQRTAVTRAAAPAVMNKKQRLCFFQGKTPVAQVESSVKPASSDTQPPAVPGSGAAGGGGK